MQRVWRQRHVQQIRLFSKVPRLCDKKQPFARQQLHETQFTKEELYFANNSLFHREKKNVQPPDVENTQTQSYQNKAATNFIWQKIIVHLLPKGFPDAVHKNYLSYVKWQTLQYIVGSMSGVLSMQALLYAVGLGSGAIPLAAALNWIIKDGLGQLGGVVFASKVSTNFDADPKKWRFRGEVALTLSTLLEIITPLFPKFFLPLASIANIGKNVSWLSASATRAAINLSFAKRDNLADITVKSGSQTIAGCLIGTGLGVMVSPFIGSAFVNIFPAFIALAGIQLYSLYRAVSVVELNHFNRQRAEILIEHFLNTNEILSPSQVAKQERFIIVPSSSIIINPKLEQFASDLQELQLIRTKFVNEKYMVSKRNEKVNLIFLIGATTRDVVQGMLHALMLKKNEQADLAAVKERSLELITKVEQPGWTMSHDFVEERPNRVEFL